MESKLAVGGGIVSVDRAMKDFGSNGCLASAIN
jgi:hypothetical protein